jgi:hypothetical protein
MSFDINCVRNERVLEYQGILPVFAMPSTERIDHLHPLADVVGK